MLLVRCGPVERAQNWNKLVFKDHITECSGPISAGCSGANPRDTSSCTAEIGMTTL